MDDEGRKVLWSDPCEQDELACQSSVKEHHQPLQKPHSHRSGIQEEKDDFRQLYFENRFAIHLKTPDSDVPDELETGQLVWGGIQGRGDRDIRFTFPVHRNFDI